MSWTDAPTEAQKNLIRKLGGDPTGAATRKEASNLIGELQASKPATPAATIDPDLTPGVYELADGRVYVVKLTKKDGDQSRRLYAKRLTETGGVRYTEAGTEVKAIDFEYERGGIFQIKASDRMDVERAKELTARYGRCLNCGRNLRAAESVERGIGPVCIKSFRQLSAKVGGDTETGGTWSESVRSRMCGGQATLKPAEPVQAPEDGPEPDEANTVDTASLRSLLSQGLGALCVEADLDPNVAFEAMADFDRLVRRAR